jgi:hypothetical protein
VPVADPTDDLGRFNLLVVGRPASGVTTLVNAVFGAKFTPADAARSSAEGIAYYRHPEGVLGVYRASPDPVAGGEADRSLHAISGLVADTRTRPLADRIHAAWFTVRWGDAPLNSDQADAVRSLAELLPVVVVVTAVPANLAGHPVQPAVQYARFIEAQLLPISPRNTVYLTNARIDPGHPSPLHGLAELAAATFQTAPEAARRAQAAARLAQRDTGGRSLPLTSLLLRAQNWQQESKSLRTAARAYWARFRPHH